MSTIPQRNRQIRAMKIVEKRIAKWSEFDEESIEYNGKIVNPKSKLAQAEFELARLKSKP